MQPADFQRFAHALANVQADIPSGLDVTDGASLSERFSVHRNNVHASLVAALCDNFPLCLWLVGEEFFRATAQAFVQNHKPQSALLHEYGLELPAFMTGFPPAQDMPWLPDVARLEIAWRESWAEADAAALNLSQLADLPATALAYSRVTPHPAARLLRSSWPVASIWQAHQNANPDLSALAWNSECVLITRPAADVKLLQLSVDSARFADSLLLRNLTIEQAAAAIAPDFPHLNAGDALGALIQAGAVQEILSP